MKIISLKVRLYSQVVMIWSYVLNTKITKEDFVGDEKGDENDMYSALVKD